MMTEFLMPFSQSQRFSRNFLLLSCCFLLQNFACHAREKCLLAFSTLSVLISLRKQRSCCREGTLSRTSVRRLMPLPEEFLSQLPELGM